MIKADKYYIRNLNKILKFGSFDMNPRPKYIDGERAHTKYITQVFEEYDISKGEFPITTLRNTAIKTGIKEILWIYQKQSNSLKVAKENGILWWDEWDIGNGTIGNRYGFTVCKYDLLNKTLDGLKSDPFSRRHIINLYQYDDLESSGGLYPCAYEVIFSVRLFRGELFLDMTLMQRSSDYIMAGYINKTQYVSFLMMVAGHCNYKVGKFVHFVQNLHIYDRHFNAAKEIIERSKINNGVQPLIVLKENKNFYDYSLNDFIIENNVGEKLKSQLEIAI